MITRVKIILDNNKLKNNGLKLNFPLFRTILYLIKKWLKNKMKPSNLYIKL